MNSYIKLIDKLNTLDFQRKSDIKTQISDWKSLFNNKGLLNLLIYKYNIHTDNFKLISSGFDYVSFNNKDLKVFLSAIGPSFRTYFTDFFASYVNFLIEKRGDASIHKFTLQSFLPLQLKHEKDFFTALYVFPEFENTEIVGLCFILLPLKIYKKEIIEVKILKDFKKNQRITFKLWEEIKLEKILTEEQSKISILLLKDFSSKEIAEKLNKKHDNILKYNIRIKDRLSVFFNIKFENAKEAVNYYNGCFLIK